MDFIKQTFADFSKDRCTTLAAALAYYTAFALPPLLYLLLSILTFGLSVVYEGDQAQAKAQSLLQSQASQMIGNEAASEEIATILENNKNAEGKWWKTLLSFVGIVIGATGVVAALQAALNQVWEVKPDPEETGWLDMVGKRLVSFGMILGLGFLLLVSLVVSSVLQGFSEMIGVSGGIGELINFAVQAIVVWVMFAAIFKYMPDAIVRWKDVFVGAALTTVLFLIGRYVLQIYFSYSEPGAQLGAAAASFAVLLVWVYYTAVIVLLGAEATQTYAVRYGSGIRPEANAVRVVEKIKRPMDATT
ncbi:YihY/virulence factor BrkB family protein [Aporhodopirellula aestuarii]|uniref:YihY/virulence factor BrkB family protein n=1 Tax=Aporhodopirellula aestuarii TaxID=2950107 RepID=A0ABT0U9X5_9BACT|nr:YihY/virulence factor BrkB family protein [Aporhodopirellula aestuarii]MCM2373664.1 YihY/virulence factor BrkB family protein [Aporhodopirellula aestuarii]